MQQTASRIFLGLFFFYNFGVHRVNLFLTEAKLPFVHRITISENNVLMGYTTIHFVCVMIGDIRMGGDVGNVGLWF